MRSEFSSVGKGFDKMPISQFSGSRPISVNPSGEHLESITAASYRTRMSILYSALKDVADGYVGLSLLKMKFRNAIDSITSFFTNSNTAERTYTFPDQSGDILLNNGTPKSGRRNLIINGNFDFWNYSTSSTGVWDYTAADRWFINGDSSYSLTERLEFTLGQTDVPGNPQYYLHEGVTINPGLIVGYSQFYVSQRIEDIRRFSGKTITISFYAKSDAENTAYLEFVAFYGGGPLASDIEFGNGGSNTVLGIEPLAINLTTSWQFFSFTVTIPDLSGKTVDGPDSSYLEAVFWMAGDPNYKETQARVPGIGWNAMQLDLSRVQLEFGYIVSGFQDRPLGEELRLCQRYYHTNTAIFKGEVSNGLNYYVVSRFPTKMRGGDGLSGYESTVINVIASSNFAGAIGSNEYNGTHIEMYRTASASAVGSYTLVYYIKREI
jgi:hypothetical protein